jgi:hypothetical protein
MLNITFHLKITYLTMSTVLPPPSIPVQNDLIAEHSARGLLHYATVLTESYERYWNLKPEINQLLRFEGRTPQAIVAALNANLPLAVQRNADHKSMAEHCNGFLEKIDSDVRVPIGMPSGYSFDEETMQFIYTVPESAAGAE